MATTVEEGSTLWASYRLGVSREVATDLYDTVYMAREDGCACRSIGRVYRAVGMVD